MARINALSITSFRFSEVSSAPNTPGVYSWYYRIELADKDIARCIEEVELATSQEARDEIVRNFLVTNVFQCHKEMPYFIALSGKLKPSYEGNIEHRVDISNTLVRRLSNSPVKLHELKKTLRVAVPMFASPIYIGVAIRLRDRLLQHVRLIDQLQNLRASCVGDPPLPQVGRSEDEDNDHKFAYEVAIVRRFRSSNLFVNTLELPIDDQIRVDLENLLNRINYPLCGRN